MLTPELPQPLGMGKLRHKEWFSQVNLCSKVGPRSLCLCSMRVFGVRREGLVSSAAAQTGPITALRMASAGFS